MFFFCKSASIAKSIVALLLLAPVFGDSVYDLSQDFPVRAPSPDCDWWQNKMATAKRDIRRFLVVENGEILCEYQRDNVQDDDVFQMWSLTKPYFLIIMGMIIHSDDYDIDYNTTLGEVFTNDSAWEMISDDFEVEFKKNITMWEMFTFRSGLTVGVAPLDNFLPANSSQLKDTFDRVGLIPNDHNIPNVVGVNLSESLYVHAIHPEEKNEWRYMTTSNVLSYVFHEVTGMTPFEFASEKLFPDVGITNAEWDTNDDGMNACFSNLRLTARGIAKLTMLLMQEGKSSSDKQTISKEFVELALSDVNYRTTNSENIPIDPPMWEGFRWMKGIVNDTTYYFGGGFMGQKNVFSIDTGRLVIIQRSNTITEMLLLGEIDGNVDKFLNMAHNLDERNFTFEVYPPTEEPSSGAFLMNGLTLFQMMALSLSLMVLWR